MGINGVSLLGQNISQSNKLKELGLNMADLQRQLTTQKKSEDYAGLGFSALTVQQYRTDSNRLQSYLDNIDTATTRVKMMSNSLDSMSEASHDVLASLESQFRDDPTDMATVKQRAQLALDFITDTMNIQLDGRYLFSGSDTQNSPFPNGAAGVASVQAQITSWFAGGTSSPSLLTNVNAMSSVQLGFSSTLSSAGPVSIRADDTTEIDISSMADLNGMKDIVRALTMAANMDVPNPAIDVATQTDFIQVMDGIEDMLRTGVIALDNEQKKLGANYEILGLLKDQHTQDKGLLQTLTDDRENADPAEISVKINALQTQMAASYQVTSLVSQLSLVNYL